MTTSNDGTGTPFPLPDEVAEDALEELHAMSHVPARVVEAHPSWPTPIRGLVPRWE